MPSEVSSVRGGATLPCRTASSGNPRRVPLVTLVSEHPPPTHTSPTKPHGAVGAGERVNPAPKTSPCKAGRPQPGDGAALSPTHLPDVTNGTISSPVGATVWCLSRDCHPH